MSLLESLATLDAELAGCDPRLLSGEDAARLAEVLARHEKACAGLRALAARRAVECGAHRRRGHASPQDWWARVSGTSPAQASRDLELARALGAHDAVREAVVAGELSTDQAREVIAGAQADPGAEAALLETARTQGLGVLRDHARRARARVEGPEERYARQHARRSFRAFTDAEGLEVLEARGAPGSLTGLVARVRAEADRIFRARRASRARPSPDACGFDACGFDAFLAVVEGTAKTARGQVDMVIVQEREALARGHAHPGERSHILGVGPIPVEVARRLAGDHPFLKGVLVNGTRVETVVHFGRHVPAELVTALGLGPGPALEGPTCSDPACHRRLGLEHDHVDPVAHGGATSAANLQPLCRPHHREKTRADRAAGLLGPRPRDGP